MFGRISKGGVKHFSWMFWKNRQREGRASEARPLVRLNLDYAAATPLLPAVADLLDKLQRTKAGNPSAVHAEGVAAKVVLEEARDAVARVLGVRSPEVIFTASGTESNNLAISGYLEALLASGRTLASCTVLTTAIEHPSIVEVLKYWTRRGVRVVDVPVDDCGRITVSALKESLTSEVVLVTFAYANSEIGTVQTVRRLSRIVRAYESEKAIKIAIHLDACQAPLWLPCQPRQLDVDMMSLDAGKCNGPKGVGILIIHPGITLESVIHGGGQERGLRAGTEAASAIASAALALVRAQEGREARSLAAASAAARLRVELKTVLPQTIFNGPQYNPDEPSRLPHNVHISIPELDTEFATIVLDSKGIAASTKSACSGAGSGESAVIRAIGGDAARAASTLRFTIDPALKPFDMKYVVDVLQAHVLQMQTVDQRAK